MELVTRHGIFTETEFRARYAIHLEAYNKLLAIEARTMLDMAFCQILPAVLRYTQTLTDALIAKKSIGAACKAENSLIGKLSTHSDWLYDACEKLKGDLQKLPGRTEEAALYYHDTILPDMDAIRAQADTLEKLTAKDYWPFPTYSDLLFY